MYDWQEDAKKHWDCIRSQLKPFRFKPTTPSIFMEFSENEKNDMDKFMKRRKEATDEYQRKLTEWKSHVE